MARITRITYGQTLVLASPQPANQSNENNLTGMKRMQSANVDFTFVRERFKQIGSADYIGDVNVTNPQINLGMNYLYTNGTNEVMLGLNVEGRNSAVLSGVRKPLKDNNFYVFVISNQSGIGRGYYTHVEVEKLHGLINDDMIRENGHIDEFVYAPYFKDTRLKFTKDIKRSY